MVASAYPAMCGVQYEAKVKYYILNVIDILYRNDARGCFQGRYSALIEYADSLHFVNATYNVRSPDKQ